MSDGTTYAFEMRGIITEWGTTHGYILTDGGERVFLHSGQLRIFGFKGPVKVGDSIHFLASKRVKTVVSFDIRQISMVIPKEPDEKTLKRLTNMHNALERQRDPDMLELPPERDFTGVVDTYDEKKGYGFIRADDGTQVLLHHTALRASGYKGSPTPGMTIRFTAIGRPKGWQAFRIPSLEQPSTSAE
jgi:cold shock CspA family protein